MDADAGARGAAHGDVSRNSSTMTAMKPTTESLSGRLVPLIGLGLALVILAATTLGLPPAATRAEAPVPDLASVENAEERKQRFIEYLHPFIQNANGAVERRRARLLAIAARHETHGAISRANRWWLAKQARAYGIDVEDPVGRLEELLVRTDIVPPSLALSQAAIESGWGTSRFAVEGNNLFGHWCFTEGCGMVPDRRPAGARHEVATFRGTGRAVERYLHNLNTHEAYAPLRELRAAARRDDRPLSGPELAAGLSRYSERGEPYVRDVRIVIRANSLEAFDATE